jgi:hypothetical protein
MPYIYQFRDRSKSKEGKASLSEIMEKIYSAKLTADAEVWIESEWVDWFTIENWMKELDRSSKEFSPRERKKDGRPPSEKQAAFLDQLGIAIPSIRSEASAAMEMALAGVGYSPRRRDFDEVARGQME